MRTDRWIALATGTVLLCGAVTGLALESGVVVVLAPVPPWVPSTKPGFGWPQSGVLWIEWWIGSLADTSRP